MATRYEYYISSDAGEFWAWGTNLVAQSFTPTTTHVITSVILKLKISGLPGTVYIAIRATDGSGYPTGADLATGSIR